MSTELTLLGWTLVLALVQIFLAAGVTTRDVGLKYNLSARDKPVGGASELAGRLTRAQHNLFETLPLFAAAVLIAHVAGREGGLTLRGAQLYLGARIAYLPVYALGTPILRTVIFMISIVGLVMILLAILHP